jgi:ABC-type nitrate/sulfonate/bicarbonate transport system substrate-binding protein
MKRILTIVGILAVVLAGIYGAYRLYHRPVAGQNTKVTCRLDWAPGAEHSFLYLAKARGYFEAVGLDVEIQAGDGSTTSAKLVGNGNVDYALCSGDSAMVAASAGVPLKVLAVLYSEPPTVIMSRKDRNITRPKDLEDKKYGANFKSTTHNQFLAFCKANDVDLKKVQVIGTAGKAEDILTNAVDASAGYTYIQPVQCELADVPVNEMWLADFGVKCYSMSIITNRTNMNPDVTRRFLQAAMKGFGEMVNGDPTALEEFLKANPTANKEFERRKLERLDAFIKKALLSQKTLGMHTAEGWSDTQAFLIDQGLLTSKIDLSGFFTTEFLPAASKN